MTVFRAICMLVFGLVLLAGGSAFAAETSEVREERTVTVDGVAETWQLVWIGKHPPVCPPEALIDAITCPCAGLAYGEYGNLWLVRRRGGHEVERMDLKPLFGGDDYPDADKLTGKAWLQRYPTKDSDFDHLDQATPAFVTEVKRRAAPVIMQFHDYDNDGQATEFLLMVGTLPCGKLQYALVGVSKRDPRLHAFASAENPKTALELPINAWQALLKTPAPTWARTWDCDDHGSEVQSDVRVSVKDRVIHARARNLSCATLRHR